MKKKVVVFTAIALVIALIILYAYPMTKPIAAALGFKI